MSSTSNVDKRSSSSSSSQESTTTTTTATATTVTSCSSRKADVDLFDPSNSALLLSLTSKKHRQRMLLTNGGAAASSAASMSSFAAPTSFAHKQMSKLGWKPGTALGKDHGSNASRIETGLSVVQRRDGDESGLGMTRSANGSAAAGAPAQHDEWWKDALGSTLARLVSATSSSTAGSSSTSSIDKKKAKKDKSKSKKKTKERRREEESGDCGRNDDETGNTTTSQQQQQQQQQPDRVRHYTDEELFVLAGGSRFGMRAAPKSRSLAKWKRTGDKIGLDAASAADAVRKSTRAHVGESLVDDVDSVPNKLAVDDAKKIRKDGKKRRRKEEEKEEPVRAAAMVTDEPTSTSSVGDGPDVGWAENDWREGKEKQEEAEEGAERRGGATKEQEKAQEGSAGMMPTTTRGRLIPLAATALVHAPLGIARSNSATGHASPAYHNSTNSCASICGR